jgi:hypothetical protein
MAEQNLLLEPDRLIVIDHVHEGLVRSSILAIRHSTQGRKASNFLGAYQRRPGPP